MNLANKLHYLMLLSGVSQIELSKQTSIERSTLTKILNGFTTTPKVDTIYTLAKYFNVDVEEFLESIQNQTNGIEEAITYKIKEILQELMALFKIPNSYTLHRKTGIPANALNDILSGKTANPKIRTLQILADFFNISIPQLCGIDPLPRMEELAPISSFHVVLPLLNFNEVTRYRNNNLIKERLPQVTTSLPSLNDQQYAIKIKDDDLFPDFLMGSILVIDDNVMSKSNDFIIVLENERIYIYQQKENTNGNLTFRRAGTKKFVIIPDLEAKVIGVVVQQIINRN